MQLRGLVVLVTGASSGIGRACAYRLAAGGARVLLHGRDREALAALSAETGGDVLVADLSAPDAVTTLAADALAVAGRLDVVVNNAGIGYAGPVAEMKPDALARLVAVNLTAPMELTRAVLPAMIDTGAGRIVFVTSIAGRTGVGGEAVYSATKGGLDLFAESLRFELQGTGVGVSVVVPGVVATEFFDRRGTPYGRSNPKPIPPERIATAVERSIVRGTAEQYLPRWLRTAVPVRATVPGFYRALAGRFGGAG